MISEWFQSWSKRHMRRFSFGEHDGETVAEWKQEFERLNVSETEAEEASRFLMANGPPSFKSKHLSALLAQVKAARQKFGGPVQTYRDRFGDCSLCSGTGMVIVPWLIHPRHGWNGRYTNSVYCTCGLGHWYHMEHSRRLKKVPMMLSDYEQQVPEWKRMMEERKEKSRILRLEKV